MKMTGTDGTMYPAIFVNQYYKAKRKNNRGVFENFVSDPSKKIILNNDNDEQRGLFESCALKGKRICNPIVDWRDSDVWDYIRSEHLDINPLYDMGFYRVGCLGGDYTYHSLKDDLFFMLT